MLNHVITLYFIFKLFDRPKNFVSTIIKKINKIQTFLMHISFKNRHNIFRIYGALVCKIAYIKIN